MKPTTEKGLKGITEYFLGDGEKRWMVGFKFKEGDGKWRRLTKRGFLNFQDARSYQDRLKKIRYANEFSSDRLTADSYRKKAIAVRRMPRNTKIISEAWGNSDIPRAGVYFIQPTGGGLIKVGHTDDIYKRFRNMQYQCPVPLTVLGVIPGDRVLEFGLHMEFIEERHHGEWFLPQGRVREFLIEQKFRFIDPVFSYTKDWEPKTLERLQEHFQKDKNIGDSKTTDTLLGGGLKTEKITQVLEKAG